MNYSSFDVKQWVKDVVSYDFGSKRTTRTFILFTEEGNVECTVTWDDWVLYGYDTLAELIWEEEKKQEIVITNSQEWFVSLWLLIELL